MGFPLELSDVQMKDLTAAVVDRLAEFIRLLPDSPVDTSAQMTGETLQSLIESVPVHGEPLEIVLDHLFNDAMPGSLNPASAGFMGYVPGGGIFYAAIADLIADTVNRFVGAAPVSPGFSQIEANVIRWFTEMMGLPSSARGFMTSGGSLANQSALATARTVRLGEDFQNAIIYLSDQAHSCLLKAARLCGFPAANVRILPSDDNFRLSVSELEVAIEQDAARGLRPFFVAASAGTTNTGAIDPLEEIANLCANKKIWFHVDAAYGGFFRLTERGKSRLSGIERADSVVLDPHKTLFLPYGTGALLVRNGRWLKQTYQTHADYLPDAPMDEEIMDFRDISPELTRPFRGLRVWLPLKLHGTSTFKAYLAEKLDLADWICQQLSALPEIEILAAPELSIMAFAVASSTEQSTEQRNQTSRRLLALINRKNRVNLTSTQLRGVFALRIAVGVFRTHQEHLEWLLEDIREALLQLKED